MASLDAEEQVAMKALEEKLTHEREIFSQAALKVCFICGNGCKFRQSFSYCRLRKLTSKQQLVWRLETGLGFTMHPF